MLSKDQLAVALPSNLKHAATQALADMVNNIVQDPLVAEQVRNNFLSYSAVLKDGKFKTEDYVHAVTFVSFKLMGDSNQDAYFKTFPQRHAALVARGATPKEISGYVSTYARGKLVNLILEQTLVPSWVLNQDLYQEAINTQARLMRSAASEKVQQEAANSLLTHLGKPKEAGPLIAIDVKESAGMNEMRATLAKMAEQQQALIQAGVTTRDIAAQTIIDVEAKTV